MKKNQKKFIYPLDAFCGIWYNALILNGEIRLDIIRKEKTMESNYQMSHNACSVLLDGGHKVIIRLFIFGRGSTPKWYFVATSQDGKHSFTSATFTSSALAIGGILEFINVVCGLFFVGRYMTPSALLAELFSDVIYK